jgi:hypothetical protein
VATISSLLAEHVSLEVRSVDRIFLGGYVPGLQSDGLLVRFLNGRPYMQEAEREHRSGGGDARGCPREGVRVARLAPRRQRCPPALRVRASGDLCQPLLLLHLRSAVLVHLPVHASWLNQIEIYFSIVQRKAMTPNDFATLPELARHLLDFAQHYRTLAQPFQWTFTRAKLDRVLEKITRSESPQLALAA